MAVEANADNPLPLPEITNEAKIRLKGLASLAWNLEGIAGSAHASFSGGVQAEVPLGRPILLDDHA